MNDFEEKYKTLMKYMLPQADKCIKSVEVVGFEEGAFTRKGKRPETDYELKTFASLDDSITPVINVTMDNECFSGGAMLNMVLRSDIFTKMLDLHELYFPDRKLNANINFINIL
jgi:hypothetical protein